MSRSKAPCRDEHQQELLLEQLARAEGLALVLRLARFTGLSNLIPAAMMAALLWSRVDHWQLGGWLALVAFAVLVRFVVLRSYQQAAPVGIERLQWERPYLLTLVAAGVVWGLGLPAIMPAEPLHAPLMVLVFLMGMAGASYAIYLSRWRMVVTVNLLLLGPIALWFLAQKGLESRLVALAVMIYLGVTLLVSRIFQERLHQSFMLALILDSARCQAERLARLDPLTGLPNRRAFEEEGALLAGQACTRGVSLALVMLDVDHFKRVNDRHGHAVGDAVLKVVARLIRRTVRVSDLCARLGGEEFGVLMLVSGREDALRLAEKLRRRIERARIPLPEAASGERIHVTASLGVAYGEEGLEALMRLADGALYEAKARGRNQVVCASRGQVHQE